MFVKENGTADAEYFALAASPYSAFANEAVVVEEDVVLGLDLDKIVAVEYDFAAELGLDLNKIVAVAYDFAAYDAAGGYYELAALAQAALS